MDIYTEIILDHFKNPHNKGPLPHATHTAHEDNPLCGDKITIHLIIKNNKIAQANFEGTGCAISQASASMLTDKLIGLSTEEVKALSTEDIYKMLNIEISPGRSKCALLALTTSKAAI